MPWCGAGAGGEPCSSRTWPSRNSRLHRGRHRAVAHDEFDDLAGEFVTALNRINYDPEIDNPDERIQQDIDGFVSGALSILLTVLGSIITYYTFVGILRDVDPTGWLTTIAYVWSLGFTVVAIGFFRRLVGLNFQQSKKEADFRYQLIHVRKYVESIAFYHSEDRESGVLKNPPIVMADVK